MRTILIASLLLIGVVALTGCQTDSISIELASLRAEMKEQQEESLARISAVQDALDSATAKITLLESQVNTIVAVNEELRENQTDHKARIMAVQKSVGSVNDKLAQMERGSDDAVAVMGYSDGQLRTLPVNTTISETKEMLAECLSSRFGAFGPMMVGEMGLDTLIDEFQSGWADGTEDSDVSESAALRVMGIVFGCWK